MRKPKKVSKPIQPKPTTPTIRASTRVTTQKAKEVAKPKEKTVEAQKRPKRKYVSQVEFDEEKIELDDKSQFQVVSHSPSSNLDNLCENSRKNANVSRFSHTEFDNLGKIEKNQVEEVVYAIMEIFKITPLELSNSIPKSLYYRVEKKSHYCLDTKKQIREIALVQFLL